MQQDQVLLINAPLGKSIACIAYETWARMHAKPRNPEVKVLSIRPNRTPIVKFDDLDRPIREKVVKFLTSKHSLKSFSTTLGRRGRELNTEEKSVREQLVNHLMDVENHAETVEMQVPKKLLKSKKDKKEKEKKKSAGHDAAAAAVAAAEYSDNDDKDTIDGFDESEFDFFTPPSSAPHPPQHPHQTTVTTSSSSADVPRQMASGIPTTALFANEFKAAEDGMDDEDDEDDDNMTVNSKFSVAIEARKRNVGRITSKEFKEMFESIVNKILVENFRINPNDAYEETILRTCLASDIFWSNVFAKVAEFMEKENTGKVDDKLVLYIRNQKK